MDADTPQVLTPAKAAKIVGCGRTSIMRALESRKLRGDRDNRNRWRISLEALEEWMANRPNSTQKQPDSAADTVRSVQDLDDGHMRVQIALAAANATIEALRAQIERDDRKHADEIRRLELVIDRLSASKVTFLQRLLRR